MARGLADAGFVHAAFVERNRDACSSLRANFLPESVFEGDIRDFDLGSLGKIDLVAGGPPCQPFSLGGKHKASDDHRDMFPHAIRAIDSLRPKAFLFENVKGLLRASFADYFEYIQLRLTHPSVHTGDDWLVGLRMLRSLGIERAEYRVTSALLNAADYGVPQMRERVIIVGIRSDIGAEWYLPAPTHSRDRLLWEQHVSGEYIRRHGLGAQEDAESRRIESALRTKYGMFAPEGLPWLTIRDAVSDLPDPRSNHGLSDHIFRDGARTYPGHTGSPIDMPSKTIKAGGHGVPGGENMILFADRSVRYLTVREAKRLQTFPDDFEITGAWGEAMRQIGNAVPVRLARLIGEHLMTVLRETKRPSQTHDHVAHRPPRATALARLG